jgi:transcriptional regulator with XRE-family HTH domain
MEKHLADVRSTDVWEQQIGAAIKSLRLRQNRTQEEVARAANVSLSALKGLEGGDGSRVRTLVLVARALGREDWLTAFAPPEPAISPMQLLRDRQSRLAHTRQRARPRPGPDQAGTR